MTLKELQYVIALADTRHFGKAAAKCFVTQSTLSLQLRRLEEYFGNQLFFRNYKSVSPTPLGLLVIPLARQAMHTINEIRSTVEQENRRSKVLLSGKHAENQF